MVTSNLLSPHPADIIAGKRHRNAARRSRRWGHLIAFALAIATLSSANAQTTVWIGKVTIGDIVRHEVANVLAAQQQATLDKAKFNLRIAHARRAFLDTAQTPQARAKAEADFAGLLLEKDIAFLIQFLNEGFSERSLAIARGLDGITGGPLDNGIPSDGRPAFEAWVRGVRASLGAPRDGQIAVAVIQPGRLQEALQANEPLYQQYKQLRDRQEINGGTGEAQRAQAAIAQEIKDAVMPDGGARLFKMELNQVYPGDFYGRVEGELYGWMTNAGNGGQQTIQCTYGPSLTTGGKKGYVTYSFWYDKTPGDIDAAMSRDRQGALRFIGSRALKECPDSDVAALVLRRSAMAEHPLASTFQAPSPPPVPNPASSQANQASQQPAGSAAEERARARSRVRAGADK